MVQKNNLMEADWDQRARDNAFHYICSDKKDWDPEAFFQSGEADYKNLVEPVCAKLGFATEGKSMLEVGCGVGRVTRTFSRHFAKVFALDVSEEMLQRGRELHPNYENIVWLHGNGIAFQDVPSASVDYVFSYLVLQHLPSQELALGYIDEMMRTLRPGGVYCFQFNGSPSSEMNWKGRVLWGLVDKLSTSPEGSFRRALARRITRVVGLDTLAAGPTWRGAPIDPRAVKEVVERSGGMACQITAGTTPLAWCFGRKGAIPAHSG